MSKDKIELKVVHKKGEAVESDLQSSSSEPYECLKKLHDELSDLEKKIVDSVGLVKKKLT